MFLRTIVVSLTAVDFLAAGAAHAVDRVSTTVKVDSSGTWVVHDRAPASSLSLPALATPIGLGGDEVQWHNNLTDAVYTQTAVMLPPASLAAGTWLNPPRETEVIPLVGDGTTTWTFPGTRMETAASRNGDVVASADLMSSTQTITICKWNAASGLPDWTFPIASATGASYRTIKVSPDGSTIGVIVTVQGNPNHARLYVFDSGSSTPISVFDAEDNTFARNLDITTDGAYVAMIFGANVYVFDRDADVLRYSASAGASNDPIAISGDGDWIAYGWQTLFVRQWTGSTYTQQWTRIIGGHTLAKCDMSDDGSTLATGWNPSNFLRNRVEVHDIASQTPDWTYLYDMGSGGLQDVPSEVSLTADASHLVVSSWGDQGNTNPELHVFARDDSTPVFTLDTPGSMFACSIAKDDDGTVYVSACGKHIHANTSGRGGDLYSIRLETSVFADLNGDGVVDAADLAILLGSWGPCDDCNDCAADLDGDCTVDAADLALLLGNWT